MKKHAILSFLAGAIALVGFAREPHNVALVVQNHAEPGATIAFMALTDALTARLASCDLRVINPYNSVGVNQNRDARGEKTPEVSAMELARRLKAVGAITASVVEFRETPPSGAERKFVIRMILNLADARTGATVCSATVAKDSPKYTATQIAMHRSDYINKLMYAVADECADKLKANPLLEGWRPSPPLPPPPPPEPLTLGDLQRVLEMLSDKMSLSPRFNERHAVVMERRSGKLPVIVVGGIGDLTGGHSPCRKLAAYRDLGRDSLQTRLGKSCRFEIKDLAAVEAMRPFIVDSPKDPLSDRALLEALRRHVSPDFFIAGHVKYNAEDGLGTYFIHLGVYDFLKGVVVWEDTVEVVKSLPKGTNQ